MEGEPGKRAMPEGEWQQVVRRAALYVSIHARIGEHGKASEQDFVSGTVRRKTETVSTYNFLL